jgi:hypothetical protein
MDYSDEVLGALMAELEALRSPAAIKARLEMLRALPGRGTNLFPHAFVSTAALPYTDGLRDRNSEAIFEPHFSRFKALWDGLNRPNEAAALSSSRPSRPSPERRPGLA